MPTVTTAAAFDPLGMRGVSGRNVGNAAVTAQRPAPPVDHHCLLEAGRTVVMSWTITTHRVLDP
jgi:hypothetical protein